MRQLAAEAGAVETVMFRDGLLTEASASNVLIVKGGTIVAPPKDHLILPASPTTPRSSSRARRGCRWRSVDHARRGARGGRDCAVLVDEGSRRDHDPRRQAVRRRRPRPGVPQALGAIPVAEAKAKAGVSA